MALSLPPELLRAIFSAAAPPGPGGEDRIDPWWHPRTVLSFEDRARAELVCKHWRAALVAEPGAFTSLSVSPPLPGAGWNAPRSQAGASEAVDRAVARAQALIARPPAVADVHVQAMYALPPVLRAAYVAAIGALLSRPGGGRSLTVTASTAAAAEVQALLAAMAPHAGCMRLELVWHPSGGPPTVDLDASQRLPSLPHVRRMSMHHAGTALVSLTLPMPRLEWLSLPEEPEMFAPIVTRAVALGVGARGASARRRAPPPFPALRQLSVATTALFIDPGAAPALEQLEVKLFSPHADFNFRPPLAGALTAPLTSLDLDASTTNTIELLEEAGEDFGEDRHVASNCLAPLLAAAAPRLRRLRLTLAEAPDAALGAALRAATGLSELVLRFTGRGWAPQGGARLDARLLRGMAGLSQLSVDAAERLDRPAALADLPLAGLALDRPAALPALAPHVPGLTRLELRRCSAAALHAAQPARQALAHLTALRRLVLGGRERPARRGGPAAASRAASRHAAALAALQAQLAPRGCEVLVEPHGEDCHDEELESEAQEEGEEETDSQSGDEE